MTDHVLREQIRAVISEYDLSGSDKQRILLALLALLAPVVEERDQLREMLRRAVYVADRAVTLGVHNPEWFRGEADAYRDALAAGEDSQASWPATLESREEPPLMTDATCELARLSPHGPVVVVCPRGHGYCAGCRDDGWSDPCLRCGRGRDD